VKRLALIVLVALALPASALAKGPSAASIVGPGLTTIRISGAEGSTTRFWRFVEAAGFFEAAYGPRLPKTQPEGDLGLRYKITWKVPSSNKLYQNIYPYAQPYPVTYMSPEQTIYGSKVTGGWFVGGVKLKKALARVSVPAEAPQPQPEPQLSARPGPLAHASVSGLSGRDIGAIVAGAVILALGVLFGVRAFRRPRRTISA
jgi:hypothetical protein